MMNPTVKQVPSPTSPTGKEAFHDDQAFAAWAEAVKHQMLAALQKRQGLS